MRRQHGSMIATSRCFHLHGGRASGSLRVEIQDGDGKAEPSFAMSDSNLLYGDQIDRTVSWKAGTDVS